MGLFRRRAVEKVRPSLRMQRPPIQRVAAPLKAHAYSLQLMYARLGLRRFRVARAPSRHITLTRRPPAEHAAPVTYDGQPLRKFTYHSRYYALVQARQTANIGDKDFETTRKTRVKHTYDELKVFADGLKRFQDHADEHLLSVRSALPLTLRAQCASIAKRWRP